MGRIVVHIGTHKTGTTSIQRMLSRHRSTLLQHGLLYPSYDIIGCREHYAHIGMANALATDHPKLSKRNAEDFFRKVRELSANYSTTLISAEPLYKQILGDGPAHMMRDRKQYWKARDNYISRFRQLIGPAEVTIVLRRQDEFAESMYQEQVKVTRYTHSFQTYLRKSWFHFVYAEQIAAWLRHFETVHVIPFNRIKGASIASKFLNEIGCDIPNLADAPMQNVSMPHDGVILKRHFNGTPLDREQLDGLSKVLVSSAFRHATVPGFRSFFQDRREHEAFLLRHADANAALARSVGIDPTDLFDCGIPDTRRYGDTITLEEHDRLLLVLKQALPNLNTIAARMPGVSPSPPKTEALKKDRPASFIKELSVNRLDYTAGGPTLVMTFENAELPRRGSAIRAPWEQQFLTEDGHSVLVVTAQVSDWYRSPDLHEALLELRGTGFFARFSRVVLTGSSMGGFAATAFASLVPGCHVISFNPQSTLRHDLVPWDDSHPKGKGMDWTGSFTDGAAEIGGAARVYIFYDAFHEYDRRHAMRYQGVKVHLLRAPFLGHGLPVAYSEMGLLKDILRHGIAGTLSDDWYYPAIRARRTLARYYKGLAAPLARHGRIGAGQALMRQAAKLFHDEYFRLQEAIFIAASGNLEAAVKSVDHAVRAGQREKRDTTSTLARLSSVYSPSVDFQPSFSVIVPVFKAWDQLPSLLDGLAAQTRQDFELIIADNEPHAYPEAQLRQMIPAVLSGRWRRIHCVQPGSYAARNAAVADANAPFLVFTDADCRPEAGWLSSLAKAERDTPEVLLAGPVQVQCREFPNAWEIFDTVRGIPQERYIAHGYATTANLGIPKAIMERMGGFDTDRFSGGDAEFCRRAGRAGIGLYLVEGAVVTHPARSRRAECETKARRIKGGQLRSGPPRQRLFWALRSLTPPVREMIGYLRDGRHPHRWRYTACVVRMRLWGVELAEMGRLLVLRREPERR